MTAFARLAVGTVAVVAVAAITVSVLGPDPGPGGQGPTTLGTPSPTADPTASPSVAPAETTPAAGIDLSDWVNYTSERYGFEIGYPHDWTVWPAVRDWTVDADATDFLSPAHEAFIAPDRSIRVSAWSVPFEPDSTDATTVDIEAWVEAYCEESENAPCTGIHERAVPLCLERRDCHPGLLVPFKDDVQAFFSGGIYDADSMTVVAVWWGETQPAVAPYGGAQRLLERFLSTMSVWPEAVPLDDRLVPAMSSPAPS